MFNHKLLATEGLYPGLATHYTIANRGEFLIEVIIEPPVPQGIGYGWSDAEYKVTVVIRRNGKEYRTEKWVSIFTGKSLEKVIVLFNKINKIKNSVNIKLAFINKYINGIFVDVKKK